VLGLRGFQRGRGVAMAEGAVGPEKVDRGEIATSTDIGLAGPCRRQGVRLGIGFDRRDLILRAQPVRAPEPD
jgi:hypothetical protein